MPNTAVTQLTGLLRMKHRIEYEPRLLTEDEARRLADAAERFVRWAGTAAGLSE
jgi:hypothetical protein